VFRCGKKSSAGNGRDVCTVLASSDALEYNSSELHPQPLILLRRRTPLRIGENIMKHHKNWHRESSTSNSPRVLHPRVPCPLLPLTGPASFPLQQRAVSCVCKAGVKHANGFECTPSIATIHKYIAMQKSGILL
jgi:hypothetical protein